MENTFHKEVFRSGVYRLFPAVFLVAACASAASCGSSSPSSGFGGTDAGDASAAADAPTSGLLGLQSLTVSPSQANLVAGDAPTSQAFTATGRFADGSTRDVTAALAWTVSPQPLLAVIGAKVSPGSLAGGYGTVTAVSGTVYAKAQVRVTYTKSFFEPGAPATADSGFTGSNDPSQAPALVYPLDGTLTPPSLGAPEVQWQPAAGTKLFDVRWSSPILDVQLYTPCNAIGTTGGCSLSPDTTAWGAIVATLRGDDPAAITVLGTGAAAGKYGTSAARSFQLASSDLGGGIYYFNTQAAASPDGGTSQAGIFRYDFAQGKGGAFFTAGQCAGCHALSHDGTKMLASICTLERGCGDPLQLAVVDVATTQFLTPPYPAGDSNIQDWTPDARYYVTSPGCTSINTGAPGACATPATGGLDLVSASTNAAVGAVPTGTGALHPSFSADGKRLVYTRGNPYSGPLSIQSGSLFTIDFTQAPTPTWGAEQPLVTSAGENNYYPVFSPDGAWVLFARSQCKSGDPPDACDSYDDPSARAMVVSAQGGKVIDLGHANGSGLLDDSWPRWSPAMASYKSGNLLWLTFSSTRDYGFHVVTQPSGSHVRQLWLVGFDPAKAAAGQDPSFAPTWLSFQDPASSNHTGQWTSVVVGPPK